VGLARLGSHHGHASGDFVVAFSVAHRIPQSPRALTRTETVLADVGRVMPWLFPAVAESVEEAVLNSLCRAVTVAGRDGHIRHALPADEVSHRVERYRRAFSDSDRG
jgi:D-aminopeptidase